ncbi:MAG: phosphate--acyl-ACP acyltransferase [Acidimicrobiaceae bacterium]|nr:phosphate--acyl-ACP acyltransferase [Acidimicrobiaceae bacterium]|tara:strand:- start:156 stop:1157 length:1002 start_codon:yes stop_codon:yes gene_type:complete
MPTKHLPIAIDAMGGDNAPGAIIEGAQLAHDLGIPVLLVGTSQALKEVEGIPIVEASEVIEMDDDPGQSVRRKKDSSLVRAAETVRDGEASAMISAGNTGATMASALLRMGRLKGVSRPAIATPIPVLDDGHPVVLLDSGANSECQPEWLLQFAEMGAVYARDRFHIDKPKVGILSIGEEAGKGNPLVKEAFALLDMQDWQKRSSAQFIGNVEGRDLMSGVADVVVTDGFTGNVALKTLEGTAKAIVTALLGAFSASPEAERGAGLLAPALLPLYEKLDPDSVGGAVLLGVKGIAMVSHGSSSAKAILNAVQTAHELVIDGHVENLQSIISAK